MLWHIWLLTAYIDFISGYFGQPCTLFILTLYFCSFDFQLSTNKVVVVVVVVVAAAVFLPLVQK